MSAMRANIFLMHVSVSLVAATKRVEVTTFCCYFTFKHYINVCVCLCASFRYIISFLPLASSLDPCNDYEWIYLRMANALIFNCILYSS